MIRKLDQRKWIVLLSELPQLDAAPVRRGTESRSHVAEWRRGRDGLFIPDSEIGRLIAIQRDTIGAQQPQSKARLSLPKELEVEIPYLLDAFDPIVRAVFV